MSISYPGSACLITLKAPIIFRAFKANFLQQFLENIDELEVVKIALPWYLDT